jgi:tetratricopeptide (TPR) repeat protein
MRNVVHAWLVLGSLAVGPASALGQTAELVPIRARLERRQAHRLYGDALLHKRNNRLPEALEALRQAAVLDPKSASIQKALVSVYVALGRPDDALAATRRALDLDDGDCETWYAYARQLRASGRPAEAVTALERACACPGVKELPDIFPELITELAAAQEEHHDYERALATLGRLAQALPDGADDPRAPDVYEAMGRAARAGGRLDKAIAALEQARTACRVADPARAARLGYEIAIAWEAQGDAVRALANLEVYLRTQPPGAEAYESQVRMLTKLGRQKDILPALEVAAKRDAHNLALKLLLARAHADQGQPQTAEKLFREILTEAPTPDVYRALFALYKKQKRPDQGLALLDEAVMGAAGPKHDLAAASAARAMVVVLQQDHDLAGDIAAAARKRLTASERLAPETRRLMAALAASAGRLDVAEDLYRDCLATALTPQTEATLYDALIQVLWSAQKYQAVADLCRRGLAEATSTNRTLFHTNLARALLALHNPDQALAEIDQAVQLAAGDTRRKLRLFRVEVFRQCDRTDRAEAECQVLFNEAANPAQVRDARSALAAVYQGMHDTARAEPVLRAMLKADPDDATAANDLGYIMADEDRNLDEAERLIRHALTVDEQRRAASSEGSSASGAYVDSLGWVLFRRGRLAEARRELERAVTLPDAAGDPVVWDHLGEVYFRLRESSQARQAWQKALTLYEKDGRRKTDRSYQELRRKLGLLEREAHR